MWKFGNRPRCLYSRGLLTVVILLFINNNSHTTTVLDNSRGHMSNLKKRPRFWYNRGLLTVVILLFSNKNAHTTTILDKNSSCMSNFGKRPWFLWKHEFGPFSNIFRDFLTKTNLSKHKLAGPKKKGQKRCIQTEPN